MRTFAEIAPHLGNPLVLTGFALLLFFGIHRGLIRSGILPPADKSATPGILQQLLRYGFVIALVLVVAGFALAAWRAYLDSRRDSAGGHVGALTGQAERIADSVEGMAAVQQRTAVDVAAMVEGLRMLANLGGLVAEPTAPAELYHNARLLAQRGEIDRALESYAALFRFELPLADPVIDAVAVLKTKYGPYGVAPGLSRLFTDGSSPDLLIYGRILSQEDVPTLVDIGFELSRDESPYLPSLVALAERLRQLGYEQQSLGTQELTYRFTGIVLEAYERGDLGRYYIDPVHLEAAHSRMRAIRARFDSRTLESFKTPVEANAEIFGHRFMRVYFSWKMNNRLAPPSRFIVTFVQGGGDYRDEPFNVFDLATVRARQRAEEPDRPEAFDDMLEMLDDVHNPMIHSFTFAVPKGEWMLVEVRYTELYGVEREFCIRIPNKTTRRSETVDMAMCRDGHGPPLSDKERSYLRFLGTGRCKGCDLSGLDLKGEDLLNGNLRDADLSGVSLASASLLNIELQGANLEAADFQGARIQNTEFDGARLGRANFTGAKLLNASFADADLRDAIFEPASQQNVEFCHTVLSDGTRSNRDCD